MGEINTATIWELGIENLSGYQISTNTNVKMFVMKFF